MILKVRSHALARSLPLLWRPMSTVTSTLPSTPSAPPPSSMPTPLPQGSQTLSSMSLAPSPPTFSPVFIPPAEDPLLSLLTNIIMRDGKRHRAAKLVTDTLSYLHSVTLAPPLPILREAVRLASPAVKVVTLRKSAKNLPSPRALNERQSTKQALRWILAASEKRSDKSLTHRLAKEVVAVVRGDSDVLKRKEEVHRQAVVNRANAPRR
ncbi:hypothetical protein M407DRAFT_245880 [Tulasnella calospora MUT 4182]|uniref:Small ribosomal subunit protein uS7 domain-containing protein n=1 Tax=Tulasnella calospora MUT 4182 TaxID=1051891 RepID=A0A0C3Q8U2_9AGAM|nr:hypothetical protein M407DRAFT_245880 [Tulasnella calospora MUT 4182]